jgi:hypothetical protein
MIAYWHLRILGLLFTVTALHGCGQTFFPADSNTDLTRVNQIRNDASLTGQEKRDELQQLGLDDVTINGLLRAERTANQFGGTENTAFDKVSSDQLTALTPDEIQLYGDLTGKATFSDSQAQELATLLQLEGLGSIDLLKAWLEDNDIDSASGLTDDDVRKVFVETDPDSLIGNLP